MGKQNRSKQKSNQDGNISVPTRATANSESPTTKIILALIAALATIAVAVIGYSATIKGTLLPIEFTQTAEARHTAIAMTTQAYQPSATNTSAPNFSPSETPTASMTLLPSATSTPPYSKAIIAMNNFYSWINSAKSPDDLINSWNLETSGVNGFQCREPSACEFSNFKEWWWNWKARYTLYDCGSNIVEVNLYVYYRDPILASTPSGPTQIRYEFVDIQGDLKLNRGTAVIVPSLGCEQKISVP